MTCAPSASVISCLFNSTATCEIYTLSLHDALPILVFDMEGLSDFQHQQVMSLDALRALGREHLARHPDRKSTRLKHLVCRLLLEKKKKKNKKRHSKPQRHKTKRNNTSTRITAKTT